MTTMKVLGRGPVITEPFRAAAAHKPSFFGKLALERWLMFGRSVDDRLKSLAQMRAASLVGCLW